MRTCIAMRLIAAMLMVGVGTVQANMFDERGMKPWEICGMCHGANGVSAMSRFPNLAGQKQAYLQRQLQDFRSGRRRNDGGQMEAISGEVLEQDVATVTAYFSRLPAPQPRPAALDREDCRAGQKLYLRGREGLPACAECHSDPTSKAPWLDAQHADYLVKQLRDFRSGDRLASAQLTTPGEMTMPEIAAFLSDEEIVSVSSFLASVAVRQASEERVASTYGGKQMLLKRVHETSCNNML